jgi:hypothetical protein
MIFFINFISFCEAETVANRALVTGLILWTIILKHACVSTTAQRPWKRKNYCLLKLFAENMSYLFDHSEHVQELLLTLKHAY